MKIDDLRNLPDDEVLRIILSFKWFKLLKWLNFVVVCTDIESYNLDRT